MKLDIIDILKTIGGWGVVAGLTTLIAKKMDFKRFGKIDVVKKGKIEAETALDLADILKKRIADEVSISSTSLQWNINLASALEKANDMNDKKQDEIDRLHGAIGKMRDDFEKQFQELKNDFNLRFKNLEQEFEDSRRELIAEREENYAEIVRLKNIISNGS